MPQIHIEQPHSITPEEVRKAMDAVLADLSEKYGLASRWSSDIEAKIERTGVMGSLKIEDKRILVDLDLSFALVPMKGKIEPRIRDGLAAAFGGTEQAAAPKDWQSHDRGGPLPTLPGQLNLARTIQWARGMVHAGDEPMDIGLYVVAHLAAPEEVRIAIGYLLKAMESKARRGLMQDQKTARIRVPATVAEVVLRHVEDGLSDRIPSDRALRQIRDLVAPLPLDVATERQWMGPAIFDSLFGANPIIEGTEPGATEERSDHTFSGGICIHCNAGHGSAEHIASMGRCPKLNGEPGTNPSTPGAKMLAPGVWACRICGATDAGLRFVGDENTGCERCHGQPVMTIPTSTARAWHDRAKEALEGEPTDWDSALRSMVESMRSVIEGPVAAPAALE